MIGAFKTLPAEGRFGRWINIDFAGMDLRAWLGDQPACLFTAAEIITLSSLPECDYFQPEELAWMDQLKQRIEGKNPCHSS